MGIFSHVFTFAVGVYIGMRTMTNTNTLNEQGPWVKITPAGVTVGNREFVKITDDSIDIFGGFVHINKTHD